MKEVFYNILYIIFSLFPIKRKILFISYYGSQYGCSPKYLSEYAVKIYPDWDVVWAFTEPEKHQVENVRKIKYHSIRYFLELYTSRVIITNYRMPVDYHKRKGQYYVMTWHSSLRLKKIEKDVESSLPASYVKLAKADSRKIDLLLSGCKFSNQIFKRAFWYDGKILQSGTPRCDIFYSKDIDKRIDAIKERLGVKKTSKILLYAPTFRKGDDLSVYNIDFEHLTKVLTACTGLEWTVLVRLHPHLQNLSKEYVLKQKNVIDTTTYDDIQELLLVADLLITDYSSLMFDFLETKRPCFLYTPDLKEYQKQDRSLYFDIMDLPFPTSMSQDELEYKIQSFDQKEYSNSINKFMEGIGSYEDGNASKRVTEYIEKWMK